MRPKEKAKELVYDNYSLISGLSLDFIYRLNDLPKGGANEYQLSKKMAFKIVNEIINNNLLFKDKINDNYWKNVKCEIQYL